MHAFMWAGVGVVIASYVTDSETFMHIFDLSKTKNKKIKNKK